MNQEQLNNLTDHILEIETKLLDIVGALSKIRRIFQKLEINEEKCELESK
jgi:hypothetical protein